mgnify:CR=1 FL=1
MNLKKIILCILPFKCCSFQLPPIKNIPIVNVYKNIDNHIINSLNNPVMRSKISLITSHGLTDIISFHPSVLLPRYFNAACLCFYSNNELRSILLFLFSIYHFSRDMMGSYREKMLQSLLLHSIFIYKPEQVVNYLFLIHTPLNFFRFFKKVDIRWFPVILICTNLIYFMPIQKINIDIIKYLGAFSIIGHIMCNSK